MTGTLSRAAALWISMSRYCHARLFASTDRCPAKRDPSPMPLGLRSSLREHSAGRNGLVAMFAEKYVEPLLGLSKRRARRRNSVGIQGRAAGSPRKDRVRAGRCAQGRVCRASRPPGRRGRGSGASQGSHRDNQQAQQCEHCRDPQRVPGRLSEGLRRRAHRRCPGTTVPGKEQVESFGSLPEGRYCRERQCRAADGRRRGSQPRRRAPCGCTRASSDATARRTVRVAVGVRCRRPRALRRRRPRRRSAYPVPGGAVRLALPGLPWRIV